MKNVIAIRYDLTSDIARLDGESQLALIDLALVWAERNRALLDEAPFELAPYAELDAWPALINS